jgi:hypothetical protein
MHLSYKKAYLGLDHFPSPAFLNWTLYTGTTSHPLHSSTGLCIQALLPIPCIPRLDSVYRHYFPSPAFLDWTLYTGTTSHPLHSSTGLCIQALLPIPCIPRLDSVYSVCIEIVCDCSWTTQHRNMLYGHLYKLRHIHTSCEQPSVIQYMYTEPYTLFTVFANTKKQNLLNIHNPQVSPYKN